MLAHVRPTVWRAERAASEAGLIAALRQLRRLGLAEFADVLLAMPDAEFPALSGVLPVMPDEAVQRALHGSAGKALMHDGVSFLRVAAAASRDLTGRPARGARILDFGCGWGRLLGLLTYFSDPERLVGLELAPAAVALAREHRMPGRIALVTDQRTLPVPEHSFDLIVSHSLFTRLAPDDMDVAMVSLRGSVTEAGLLALTVRPVEFWDFLAQHGDAEAPGLRARHLQNGFAVRETEDGRCDVSVDVDWFAQRHAQWELRGTDRGWDELATVLLLTPR
jgi:SAM-dependent methyltransferase